MKKIAFLAKTMILAAAVALTSCGGSQAPQTVVANDSNAVAVQTINIRYIDGDSIVKEFHMYKDFQEAERKASDKLENAQRAKAAGIQKFAVQVEEKMRSNGYLSEASYKADVEKLNKMQADAEAYLAREAKMQKMELERFMGQINDSIESFIKDYNATHGYDAILLKNAGVYFNPALDITGEVIEGLNARYNKVK